MQDPYLTPLHQLFCCQKTPNQMRGRAYPQSLEAGRDTLLNLTTVAWALALVSQAVGNIEASSSSRIVCLSAGEFGFVQRLSSRDLYEIGELVGIYWPEGSMSSPAECGAFVIDRIRCLSPDVMLLVQEALVELGNSGTVPGEGEQRQQWAARSDAAAAHHQTGALSNEFKMPAKQQQLRVDPADGKAYPLDSFLDFYGEDEGKFHFNRLSTAGQQGIWDESATLFVGENQDPVDYEDQWQKELAQANVDMNLDVARKSTEDEKDKLMREERLLAPASCWNPTRGPQVFFADPPVHLDPADPTRQIEQEAGKLSTRDFKK